MGESRTCGDVCVKGGVRRGGVGPDRRRWGGRFWGRVGGDVRKGGGRG